MDPVTNLLDRLRQPEYTGENRCIPCTAVNVGIAIALCVALGYWFAIGAGVRWIGVVGGLLAFLTALGVIYLRGYLVPYTPTLTKRYFPDRVLRKFDKTPDRTQSETVEDLDVERTLHSLGAIDECRDRDDLCLTPSFQRQWRDRMTTLRETDPEARRAAIAELLDLDDDHTVEEFGNAAAVVMVDGAQVGQWESDAAFIADLAADEVLRERSDRWSTFSVPNRGQLLTSLRMFLEQCPACDSPVTMNQDTVESCCRSRDVIAVTCTECQSRLFEVDVTPELQEHL